MRHLFNTTTCLVVLAVSLFTLNAFGADVGVEEHQILPEINKEYANAEKEWTKWLLRFENESREIYHNRIQIMKALQLKPGMAVADVGSGTGFYTFLIAQEVGPSGKVYAVDIVPAFLKHVKEKAEKQNIKQIKTVLCSKKSVCLPDKSIDLAFVCDTYHHLEYPHTTMVSINKALKPNGKLVVIDLDRIPGKSTDWVLKHVRAGKASFIKEIQSAGFRKLKEETFLKENFMITFVKTATVKK